MKTTLFPQLLGILLACGLQVPVASAQPVPDRVQGSPYPYTAVPDRLYLTSENYSPSERVALQTLMGVIAQEKPEILRDISGHRGLVEKTGITIDDTYYTNFPGLLAHFAGRLDGYILCNAKDRSTNVAISLAGVMNAVAIPADIEQTAINAGLTMLLDVRGRNESWALAHYGHLFSKNIASYQQSSDDRVGFLADYSTYTKAFQFWDDSPTGPLADSVYNRMNKGAAFFGWGPQEYETVEQLSQHSMMILPSDWAPNLSALTNIPATKDSFRQKDPIQPFEVVPNVHTVCFVISDGDNVQWLLGTHDNMNNWNNPNRGRVNLGWTISPSLAELAPVVYEKYIDNCLTTPDGRNVLIAGPSGRGYHLPGRYPDADLETECTLLNRYMKKADLRIVNIIDADDSDNDPSAYLEQDNIDALFYYSYGANYTGRAGQIDWYGDKPSIGGRYTLWGTLSSPQSLAAQLNQASTDIYSGDGYSLISVHVWSRSVNDVLDCISRLGPNVRVVAPDEFVWLIRKNLKGLPAGTGNGLKAQYYDGYHHNALKYEQTDRNVDFDWGAGSPNDSLLGVNQFSVKWSGQVQPLYSGQYTFYVYSDDGVKLTVNGQSLIDDYNTQGAYTRSGSITLTAGQKYDIELRYAEGNGDAFCHLEWQSARQQRQVIPRAQLYSRPASTAGPVTVYQHANYGGFHAGLPIGSYKLAGMALKGIRNNEISSLKIREGYKVVLYKQDNFQGDSLVLTGNAMHLPGWNDSASSMRVLANGDPGLAGTYTIRNVNSGLFLDVRGGTGGLGDGVNIQLWNGTGAANQTFNLRHLGDGRYTITAYHSAKNLDVAQSDTAENANIWQWTGTGAANQQFIALPAGNGYYKFVSVLSGKVIAIRNESTAPEANVELHMDTAQASARWELIVQPPMGNGNGLTADYYNGMNFETFVLSRIDPKVDFDWGEGAPADSINADGYSVRWTGKIEPRYSGEYTFYITSDNGRRLWVNNQLVIDKWIDDWDVEYSGTITLTAGQQYDIKLEYFENYGGANCRLRWSSASQPKEIIPQHQLYATPSAAAGARMMMVNSKPAAGEDNRDILLYPNPASGNIRLQFKGKQARMIMYDVSGQVVMPARIISSGEAVDISTLQDGLYLIRIEVDGVTTTKRLFKG
ncbi:PA14 domain-containing protein [Chitinophaga japonensis]|uniref:Putative secreted protein (Por secretion system target) n=1 Tax=Chitinophaga japonensis TaxID=104662 RepID=A0A562SYH2_CHIJA|nr:PA14 domain-containing protein [Chitinophaga japonensis]TWI86395.1 putative secreted protein (Por secretion system target) [Chitinophaga japonensis]